MSCRSVDFCTYSSSLVPRREKIFVQFFCFPSKKWGTIFLTFEWKLPTFERSSIFESLFISQIWELEGQSNLKMRPQIRLPLKLIELLESCSNLKMLLKFEYAAQSWTPVKLDSYSQVECHSDWNALDLKAAQNWNPFRLDRCSNSKVSQTR